MKLRSSSSTSGDASGAGARIGSDRVPEQHIAVAAYFIAERRGFGANHELDDWLEAERLLAAGDDAAEDSRVPATGDAEEHIKPDEIRIWSDKLDVSISELRTAIHRAGSRVVKVREFLQKRQSGSGTAPGTGAQRRSRSA